MPGHHEAASVVTEVERVLVIPRRYQWEGSTAVTHTVIWRSCVLEGSGGNTGIRLAE